MWYYCGLEPKGILVDSADHSFYRPISFIPARVTYPSSPREKQDPGPRITLSPTAQEFRSKSMKKKVNKNGGILALCCSYGDDTGETTMLRKGQRHLHGSNQRRQAELFSHQPKRFPEHV